MLQVTCSCFFFFNDTATTEIYTLSLHDALPISARSRQVAATVRMTRGAREAATGMKLADADIQRCLDAPDDVRSEEHTSELQSRQYLVCRLLLEKKKYYNSYIVSLTHTVEPWYV